MILVGEPHPDFPLEAIIRSMGLSAHVRVLGFAPIEDFVGYMAACDIVLNLRYPTVGESSGTLLRALGLGKAVLVSERRLVSGVPGRCLPEGAGGTRRRRPDLRIPEPAGVAPRGGPRAGRARRGTTWRGSATGPLAARRYAEFLEAVARDRRVAGRCRHASRAPGRSRGAASRKRPRAAPSRSPKILTAEYRPRLGRQRRGSPSTSKRTRPASPRRSKSRRPAAPATASWRWARICKSRPRCAPGWATARCAAATTASWAASTIAR